MQNFRALGAPPPDPQNSPPLRISGYAPVLDGGLEAEHPAAGGYGGVGEKPPASGRFL